MPRAIALAMLVVFILCGRERAADAARASNGGPQGFSPLEVAKHVAVRIERPARISVSMHRVKPAPAPITEALNELPVACVLGNPGLAVHLAAHRSPTLKSLHRPRARSSLEPPSI